MSKTWLIHYLKGQRNRALNEIDVLKKQLTEKDEVIDQLKAALECHPDSDNMKKVLDQLFDADGKHKRKKTNSDPTDDDEVGDAAAPAE